MTINKDLLDRLYTPSGADDLLELMRDRPTPYRPIVTQQDATAGFITRYFVKPVTEKNYIVEVNEDDYKRLQENSRFITTQVKWKIVGMKYTLVTEYGARNSGVLEHNILEVSKADLTFGNLGMYIKNYLEFWIAETI